MYTTEVDKGKRKHDLLLVASPGIHIKGLRSDPCARICRDSCEESICWWSPDPQLWGAEGRSRPRARPAGAGSLARLPRGCSPPELCFQEAFSMLPNAVNPPECVNAFFFFLSVGTRTDKATKQSRLLKEGEKCSELRKIRFAL